MRIESILEKFDLIGDVRGVGLFVGIELVKDRKLKTPATEAADYVVNQLRKRRILVGLEGPSKNIIKIRPPLCMGNQDVLKLLDSLEEILCDTTLQ